MTTIAAGRLTESLQSLVDARLDTIDRMLLGRVNRHDRLAIVREVETQIFDLLEARNPASLDRDDVLAVLARLDPPEAYLPDEASGEAAPSRFPNTPRPANRPSPSPSTSPSRPSRLPKASGILGIVAFSAFLFDWLLFTILDATTTNFSDLPKSVVIVLDFSIFGLLGLSFLLGVLAIITAAASHLKNGWAITGLVNGILAMFASVIGFLFLFVG